MDCIFYLDGEEQAHLKAGVIRKFPLAKGEYELMFVCEDNASDRLELEYEMSDVDKLQKVTLSGIREARLQKEAEEKRIAEEKRQAEEERKRREEEERSRITFKVGSVTFNMIRVKGGSFLMGSPDKQMHASQNEKPQHEVRLSGYFIGETQVTQALWKEVMGSNPSFFMGDSNPVERVSWDECQKFLKELNSKTGHTFRLPTEAEWEYAARGGNKSQGYKYAGSSVIDNVAWYQKNSKGKTHPVKQKQANELGLYDMSGNVWEWCQDRYGIYGGGKETNPKGPSKGSSRVARGGCLTGPARFNRVTCRSCLDPSRSGSNVGLRLALA